MSIDKELLTNDIRECLVKIEGIINLLKRTPELAAYRRAQGTRDKLVHVLMSINEAESDAEVAELADEAAEAVESTQESK